MCATANSFTGSVGQGWPLLSIISAIKGGVMKKVLAVGVLCVGVLCVVALSLAAGQSATKVEDEIKKLEQDWAQASIKSGATVADQYEADDIIKTDPSGGVTNK